MNNNTVKLENDVEIYENKISEYLDQYIVEKNIEDMSREPQSRWNAALIYIYKNIFKEHKDSLKGPDRDTYNDELINNICDIYIELCYEYDKEIHNAFRIVQKPIIICSHRQMKIQCLCGQWHIKKCITIYYFHRKHPLFSHLHLLLTILILLHLHPLVCKTQIPHRISIAWSTWLLLRLFQM